MKPQPNGGGGGDAPDIAVPLLVPNNAHPFKPCLPVSGSTSFFKTWFNGVNALSGVGILSIPFALASGGWLSLVLFFLIAACTFYTALLIQKCMDTDPTIRTYPDIGERAFGHTGRTLVSIAMNFELYLVATGFLIVDGDNLHSLFSNVKFQIGDLTIGGKHGFILIVGLLLMLPTIWSDNMSILSYVSAGGVISSSTLLCTIFWAAAIDGIGFHEKGTVLINPKGIPTAVSLYSFCYCAHPVFPTMYTSMRNQNQYPKVMFAIFLVCTMGYAAMAVMGYLMFGSNIRSQITLNLPNHWISSKVAIYMTIVNPLAKYALMVTPIVNAIESCGLISNPRKGHRVMVRMCLVLSTVIVALWVPFFGYLMSLVGAFLSITASVTIPSLCYLKISGLYRTFGIKSVALWGIVLVGVVILILGTYVALQEID